MNFVLSNRLFVVLATLLFVSLLPAIALADSTEVVSGDTSAGENQPGWLFNRDLNNATPIEFNDEVAVIGDGALYVLPLSNVPAKKFIGEYFAFQPVAELNSFSYNYMIGSGGEESDANEFYLNVYMNFGESPSTKYYDCKYDVVPTTAEVGDWETVVFDPTQAYPVTKGTQVWNSPTPYDCPSVPADMEALSPGSIVRMYALNMGDTGAQDEGLDGFFDNVIHDTTDGVMTYDFDPFARSLEITAPAADYDVVSGTVDFAATYVDEDGDDGLAWAVRTGTCAPNNAFNVAGNVGGFSTAHSWDGAEFSASVDMSLLPDGDYCLIVNPLDDGDEDDLRATRWFTLDNNPDDKMACMDDGWMSYGFSNQGQCVRFVETGKDSRE